MKLKLSEAIQVTKSEMGQSADLVYKKRRVDIEKQIKILPQAMKKIDALQKKDSESWAWAGSLGQIKEDLEKIIYHLQSMR